LPGGRCLGDPDVMVSTEHAQHLGAETAAQLQYRADFDAILNWHGLKPHLDRVIDAQSLFDAAERSRLKPSF
jgi:hypothetical protein